MSIDQRDLEKVVNNLISRRLMQFVYGRGAGPSLQNQLARVATHPPGLYYFHNTDALSRPPAWTSHRASGESPSHAEGQECADWTLPPGPPSAFGAGGFLTDPGDPNLTRLPYGQVTFSVYIKIVPDPGQTVNVSFYGRLYRVQAGGGTPQLCQGVTDSVLTDVERTDLYIITATCPRTEMEISDRLLFSLGVWAATGLGKAYLLFDGATYLSRVQVPTVAPANASALGWWDAIADGGLTGDGSTDDTPALNTLIDTVATAGGGTIYFPMPAAYYKIAGALQDVSRSNAQILLPRIGHYSGDPISIRFLGENVPSMHYATLSSGGLHLFEAKPVRLKSTLASGNGAMVGAWGPAGTSYEDFTHINFTAENLVFEMPDNPTNSCLDLSHVGRVELRNVKVKTPAGSVDTVVQPTTATSYGVKLPKQGNGAWTVTNNLLVAGFYNGFQAGEHWTGNHVSLFACLYGMSFPGYMYPVHLDRVVIQNCPHALRFLNSVSWVQIDQLNIEQYKTPGAWYTYVDDVVDAGNLAYGLLVYYTATWGVGPESPLTFTQVGGSHLECVAIDTGWVTDHGALVGLGDDDHLQYQLRAEKGEASGYAGLDETTRVPLAQLGTGAGGPTKVLFGDRAWKDAPAGSEWSVLIDSNGNPIVGDDGNWIMCEKLR